MTAAAVVSPRERAIRLGTHALGVTWLAIALLQTLDPAAFVEHVGPFGVRNDHYVRDVASWYGAAGVTLLLAAPRPSWRVPVLTLVLLQGVLHLVNHLWDVGAADPGWMGPADAVLLLGTTAVTWWLLDAARRVEAGR